MTQQGPSSVTVQQLMSSTLWYRVICHFGTCRTEYCWWHH